MPLHVLCGAVSFSVFTHDQYYIEARNHCISSVASDMVIFRFLKYIRVMQLVTIVAL